MEQQCRGSASRRKTTLPGGKTHDRSSGTLRSAAPMTHRDLHPGSPLPPGITHDCSLLFASQPALRDIRKPRTEPRLNARDEIAKHSIATWSMSL